jgi:hypothetical protein
MSDQEDALMYNLRFVLRENQGKRLFLLRKLFEMSFGVPCLVAISLFQNETGWYEHDIYEAARYLSEEGLLTIQDDDGSGHSPRGPYLFLTHKGIVEVEQSITSPTKATEHFAATVIQHFNASVGTVQTGPNSTAHATQQLVAGPPEAFKRTESLRRHVQTLPDGPQEEATQLIEALEDEFRLSKPRKARVKAFLRGLDTMTDASPVKKVLKTLAKQYDVSL